MSYELECGCECECECECVSLPYTSLYPIPYTLYLIFPQPKQRVNDQPVLNGIAKSRGQLSIGFVFVVDVVVAHVHVKHAKILVRPNHGIIAAVPDLVLLWSRAKGKAR